MKFSLKTQKKVLSAILVSLALTSCSWINRKDETLTMLVFPDSGSVEETKKNYVDFVKYFEDETNYKVDLIIGETYQDIKNKVTSDKIFDIIKFNGVLYSQNFNPQKYEIFAQESSAGESTYNSILIVRANSKINSIRGLKGKKIALNNKFSTSGALIPILSLADSELRPGIDYQYQFSGSHLNTAKLVINGNADAGALSWKLLKGFIRDALIDPSSIRIIDVSSPIPLSPWVLNKTLEPVAKDKIRSAFFGLSDRKMLKAFSVSGFIPVQGDPYVGLRQNSEVYTDLIRD